MNYEKYIKYKNKYNQLKNQYGGLLECDGEISYFNNAKGTCWMLSIIMIYLVDNTTAKNNLDELAKSVQAKDELEDLLISNKYANKILYEVQGIDKDMHELTKKDLDTDVIHSLEFHRNNLEKKLDEIEENKETTKEECIIIKQIQSLLKTASFSYEFLSEKDWNTYNLNKVFTHFDSDTRYYIKKFFMTISKRFYNKEKQQEESKTKPTLVKQKSLDTKCEEDLNFYYFMIFPNIRKEEHGIDYSLNGGYIWDNIFLLYLLAGFLANEYYYISPIEQNLELDKSIGCLISVPSHMFAFYLCKGKEMVCDNSNTGYYNWKNLITKINTIHHTNKKIYMNKTISQFATMINYERASVYGRLIHDYNNNITTATLKDESEYNQVPINSYMVSNIYNIYRCGISNTSEEQKYYKWLSSYYNEYKKFYKL